MSLVFSYLMENLSHITVLEFTFLCDMVVLLLDALVSLIAVKKEKKKMSPYPDVAAFYMSVCIHKTMLLRLCKVCGWVGACTCSRNFEGGRIQVSVTLEKWKVGR